MKNRFHLESLEPRRLLSVFGTDAIPKAEHPAAVRIADFNNDGIDDIGLEDSTHPFSFEIYMSSPHGHRLTQSISTQYGIPGDFDGDGDVDLLGADNSRFFKFFENTNGTLIEDPARLMDNGTTISMLYTNAIDLDGDNDLDFMSRGDHAVFHNDGTGRFTYVSPLGNANGSGLQIIDLDRDGDEDLLGFDGNALTLFRNDQTGRLIVENLNLPTTVWRYFSYGDVDGDDDIDLVYPGGTGNYTYQVAYNDGTGHFPTSAVFTPFQSIATLNPNSKPQPALFDVDDDGDLDLLATGHFWDGDPLAYGLIASLNNGDGTFAGHYASHDNVGVVQINGAANSRLTVTGDFDGDGRRNDVTLHFAQPYTNSTSGRYLAILKDPSIPTYTTPDSTNWTLGEITRADFNHDNIPDLVVGSETSSVLSMNSDGSYQSTALDGSTNRPTPSDLDNDGWVDLIDSRDGVIKWWRNVQGQFTSSQIVKTIGENLPFDRLRFDDFDGNGKIDVILMTQTTQTDGVLAKVWLQSSQVQFNDAISVAITGPLDDPADFTDIDGDGDLDVIGRQRSYRLEMNPTPTFVAQSDHSQSLTSTLTSLSADWDDDGDLDIASINETNGRIELLENNAGAFTDYTTISAANIRATNRRAIDIDGDRDLDIVAEFQDTTASARDYVLGVFYNDGEGNFSNVYFDAFPLNSLNFELSDFNGDELPDVLIVGDVTNDGRTDPFVYTSINRLAPDLTAPTVSATFERNIPATRFTFSENVFNSLDETDFELKRLENNSTINSSQLNLEWEASTNSVLVHYTGSSNGAQPDGHYRFTIDAENVSDASGNTLEEDFTFNFNVYAGDVDGDGTVSFSDLLIVAQNYGSTSATFDRGDLDYDGDVDFEDLLLVAQRYGTSLPQLRPLADVNRPFRSIIR